jgi:hypothetical protein
MASKHEEVKQMTRFENPRRTLGIWVAMTGFYLMMLYVLGVVFLIHIELLSDISYMVMFVMCCFVLVLAILGVASSIPYFIADIHSPGAGWRWARADVGPEWEQ